MNKATITISEDQDGEVSTVLDYKGTKENAVLLLAQVAMIAIKDVLSRPGGAARKEAATEHFGHDEKTTH